MGAAMVKASGGLRPPLDWTLLGDETLPTSELMPCSAFYSAPQSNLCKRFANGESVRLSIRHTPVLCQNEGTRDAVFTVG